MAHRLLAGLVGVAGLLVAAPAAQGALVYVKNPNSVKPTVWIAEDDGTGAKKVGGGSGPTISPDGKWVAWRNYARDAVMLRKASGGKAEQLARSIQIGEMKFTADSAKLGIVLRKRLLIHELASGDTYTVATGFIRGFSFSPDSLSIVYGTSGANEAFDAPSDLYAAELNTDGKTRVTRDRKSLYPLWGPSGEIVFDRQTLRKGDAPRYNLFAIHPDGGALRRITSLKIPPLLSGLVPVEMSADGRRLLAQFIGQDTTVGFAVNPLTGKSRALSKNFETGFVAANLSADGRTVLGMTGGPDPANRHDVVTMPYAGGKPTVLVKRASDPDWTR
jgi:hypothetical protein